MPQLTETETAMLAFERRFYRHAGAREQAIVDEFKTSPWIYQQRLRALIRRLEAQRHDPQTVNRLLRLEEQRRRARSG